MKAQGGLIGKRKEIGVKGEKRQNNVKRIGYDQIYHTHALKCHSETHYCV